MGNVLDITEAQKNDVVILRVKGKLDSILSTTLEKKIFHFINAGQNKLLLDLAEVTYVNSAGLRMLLCVKKKIQTLSGQFIICNLCAEVMEVMKICGFDHVIDIVKTEEEAWHKF